MISTNDVNLLPPHPLLWGMCISMLYNPKTYSSFSLFFKYLILYVGLQLVKLMPQMEARIAAAAKE